MNVSEAITAHQRAKFCREFRRSQERQARLREALNRLRHMLRAARERA